jgi:dTDP-glucose 4,6-dehydratase
LNVPGGIDVIYHFASPASPVDYLEVPIQTMRVGSLGMAKDKSARYVLASTSAVYGNPEVHPQSEFY